MLYNKKMLNFKPTTDPAIPAEQGNRHPRVRREGGVPAGVNHRAAYQTLPPTMIAASQHFSLAFSSDACILYSNLGLRPKLNFVAP